MLRNLYPMMVFSLILLSGSGAFAELKDLQMTVRTGMVQGSYSNPLQATDTAGDESNVTDNLEGGGFSVMPSFDANIEMFSTQSRSYFARTIIALDTGTGTMHYNYFGLGINNYYKGIGIEKTSLGKMGYVKSRPVSRQYYGYDIGFSRVAVLRFGSVLRVTSTGIDVGGHWGYIKQMSNKWGLNAEVGASYALGISTVSAAGFNIKILFGATFSI